MAEDSGYKHYLAGLLAGVSTVIVGHPFDTVKVKLQKHNTEAHVTKHQNALQCTTRILKTEGVKGLYRGGTSSFLGMAFEGSLAFGIYSQTKEFLQGGVQSGKPQLNAIFPAGAFGGAIISFILCPTELVKASESHVLQFVSVLRVRHNSEHFQCRMQVQGKDSLVSNLNRYNSPLDCALVTIKQEGLTGMFRGGYATFLRESLGNAIFFSTYEHVRYYMNLQLKDSSSTPNHLMDVGVGIMSGGLGGIAFWSVVLPFDVAKTIVQTSRDKNSTRNPFIVLVSVYRKMGIQGCYLGLSPTVARAFPANAAAIVTWELAIKMLGIKDE